MGGEHVVVCDLRPGKILMGIESGPRDVCHRP